MVIRLENGLNYAPDHIEVHLLFQLRSLVPWTAIIQHSFGLVASIYYDSFNEISVLERNEYIYWKILSLLIQTFQQKNDYFYKIARLNDSSLLGPLQEATSKNEVKHF